MELAISNYIYELVANTLKIEKNPRGKPKSVFVQFEERSFTPVNQEEEGLFLIAWVKLKLKIWIDSKEPQDISPLLKALLSRRLHFVESTEVQITLLSSSCEHSPENYLEILDLEVIYPLYEKEKVSPPPSEVYFNYAPKIGAKYEKDYKELKNG